ncbi:MBL fold metallo-hydrolase [Aestuariirhabdus sp. Z084]|uniref:alkyl/aryl-sulfatase n=1 Tax=Aestuariirhabdus haliotis TaxID=2918751 RepID=UPI00201B3CC8|nr:alkyl sulfatase dimerization domain-containing protein [Aestuariirhabdus haliotis]MCL6414115.1 MBL fold metallo-hydrolase [Aestuariirhabdus haliotis]MCL6418047.1 MBL fold metallo-hydrolase [Aestuariirhabdus haliotis]
MTSRMAFAGLLLPLLAALGGCSDDSLPEVSLSEASQATMAANRNHVEGLNWQDTRDFDRIGKGLIARPDSLVIAPTQTPADTWNMDRFAFIEGDAPDTVNPSLWRQAKLNNDYGLYRVAEGIYQVRGYDLAVMSIIESDSGYLVIDPLTSKETAQAGMELVYEHLGKKPVRSVIITHSHIDHFAGIKGVVSQQQVDEGEVSVIVPAELMEHAIAENVLAGAAMTRRASYMFGSLLPEGPTGYVGSGLGKSVAMGTFTLINPTREIEQSGTRLTLDGVEIEFFLMPGTEAPSEMVFFFPGFKALMIAEEVNHTMHNLYTLRGAKVRDSLNWAKYLDQVIQKYAPHSELMFGSHHWPVWGNQDVTDLLEKQRDLYKFIHDQTLHYANRGYTPREIAEQLELPPALAREWANRGYYGTLSHNVKAVYQYYLGWFDGNPANLNPLPPEAESKKYVDYMGGAEAVMAKAQVDIEQGEYRFAATVLNKLVFADPDNRAARDMLAQCYEQMGFQAESGPWRNFYLTGAQELRVGVIEFSSRGTASADIVAAMTVDMFFDYMAVQLNAAEAEDSDITINWNFVDTDQQYMMWLRNGVLNYRAGVQAPDADATMNLSRDTLNGLAQGNSALGALVSGDIDIDGSLLAVKELFGLLHKFDPTFDIVTP